MTISYEVRKAVVLLKHSSFFDKIFEKRYCTKNFLIVGYSKCMIVYDYPTSTEESVFPMGKNEKGMVRNESISGINQGRTFNTEGRA